MKILGGKNLERLYLVTKQIGDTLYKRTQFLDIKTIIARHKARYYLAGLFCRPGYHLLDFPCGSGYAKEIFKELGVIYYGKDICRNTIKYARSVYQGNFSYGDLTNPQLKEKYYDVITCTEGLEHIKREAQVNLIEQLKKALKSGGVLIVSSPESNRGVSGPNPKNEYHLHELTEKDFRKLLCGVFGVRNVEIITQYNTLTTGERTRCFYGVCHNV